MNSRLVGLVATLAFSTAALAAPNTIERVEPPHWWTGFNSESLQLLVYGDGIGAWTASVDAPGVAVDRLVRTRNPNYLFVYLAIGADAEAGTFEISFSRDDVEFTYPYVLQKRNEDPGYTKGFGPADAIYLITPDRFANADPSNDDVESLGDPADRSEPYGRHGGDIAGIAKALDYIRDLGMTAIWLNPVLENRQPEGSYHGYATTDYYAVDPRFGSNEELKRLAERARGMDIGLIMDMIPNHAGSGHWWLTDLPAPDWLNGDGEIPITTHRRTVHQDPYVTDVDERAFTDGWFTPTMPDLNQRHPLLADYLVQNALWWTEYLGLAGIRVDTYPYSDKSFMAEWTLRLTDEYPSLNIVGEEWSENAVIVSYWQRGKTNHDGYVSFLPSLMDFPLNTALTRALKRDVREWQSPWEPVYELLGTDFLYPDPHNLTIFPDNHDMSRIATQLNDEHALVRIALVFYATMRGIPQFYYGTEIGMSHPGTESHGAIRSDFPGGWAGDSKNAFTGEGLDDKERELQSFVRRLLNWRRGNTVVHNGTFMHYAPVDEEYVYFRHADEGTVMVALNQGDEQVALDVERYAQGIGDAKTAVNALTRDSLRLDRDLQVPAKSFLILELN